jgi:lipoate-protein ligase B
MQEPVRWRSVGLCAYRDGLALQEQLWGACCRGGPDVCLALEHPPTITFGRRATAADLRVAADTLAARGVACVAADRGGRATYHGPGQLVLYPIIALRPRSFTVQRFVWTLEEIMIEAARAFGIDAWRDPRGRGVWAAGGKLGAVGIRVRRGISTHGLALNVDTDLAPYDLLVPCGLRDTAVTSLGREGAARATVEAALPVVERVCARLLQGGTAEGIGASVRGASI